MVSIKKLDFRIKFLKRGGLRKHSPISGYFNVLLTLLPVFGLLQLPIAQASITTVTVNKIEGSPPYILLEDKLADSDTFLSIKLDGNTYISDADGNIKKVNSDGSTETTSVASITMPDKDVTFNVIKTFVPADGKKYSLNDESVIPLSARKSDNGDGNFTIAGNLTGIWRDKNGNEVKNLDDTLIPCSSPYTLTIMTTNDPSISTQYGNPNVTTYGNAVAKYTFNTVSQPTICFAKPNMDYADGKYAGPASQWDTTNGFVKQSIKPETYHTNFPTVGANNLYFDLDIAGVSDALTWNPVTVGGITATMSDITATSVRVTLTGPTATSAQIQTDTPGPIEKATLPARFELVGRNGSSAVVTYGFELNQWFINRGTKGSATSILTNWCKSAGYSISRVMDLTNATGQATAIGGTIPTPNQTPSPGNYGQRRIGGGLFSEWGALFKYSGANFMSSAFWTSDLNDKGTPFFVYGYYGDVGSYESDYGFYGICKDH